MWCTIAVNSGPAYYKINAVDIAVQLKCHLLQVGCWMTGSWRSLPRGRVFQHGRWTEWLLNDINQHTCQCGGPLTLKHGLLIQLRYMCVCVLWHSTGNSAVPGLSALLRGSWLHGELIKILSIVSEPVAGSWHGPYGTGVRGWCSGSRRLEEHLNLFTKPEHTV